MNRLLYLPIAVLMLLADFSVRAQNVDFDTSIGKKKLTPLQSYSSKLPYNITYESVKLYFKDMRFEETGSNHKIMTLKVLQRSELRYEFLDYDLSGKFETIKEYKEGELLFENKIVEESNLIGERTVFNAKNRVAEVLLDVKRQGFFSERNIYEDGKIVKTLKDLDGDGLFEQEFVYFLKNKPVEKHNTVDLNTQKQPLGFYCIFGGFYLQDKATFYDEDISQKVSEALTGSLFGGYEITREIAQKIYQQENKNKELGRKFVTRIDIFQAVEQSEAMKKEKNTQKRFFILSGKIYKTGKRVSVYYRVNGPDALSTVFSAVFHSAGDRYNINDLVKDVKAKMQEYFTPITDEKGIQDGIRMKNVNP